MFYIQVTISLPLPSLLVKLPYVSVLSCDCDMSLKENLTLHAENFEDNITLFSFLLPEIHACVVFLLFKDLVKDLSIFPNYGE